MTEIWKSIPGFEGYYEVSNLGRVKSLDRKMISQKGTLFLKPGRIRKLVPNYATGYLTVILCGKNMKKTMPVHRLVALAFLENPQHCECVNHKNEDKHDNMVDNLEWCSKAYNNAYGKRKKASYKPVVGKNIKTGKELVFPNARIASKVTGANYKNISACCRGLRVSAGNYEWRFIT